MTRTKQGRRFGRGRYNGQPEQGGMMQGQEIPQYEQMQHYEQDAQYDQVKNEIGMEGHSEHSEMGMNPDGQYPMKEGPLLTDMEMPNANRFDMGMIGQDEQPGFPMDQQYRDGQAENFLMMNRGQTGEFKMGMNAEGQEGILPGEPGNFNRGNFRGRWRGRGRGRGRGYAGFPMQRKRKASTPKVEGKFECEICSKTFTGPVPFNFHMDGKNHQKKAKLISDSKDNPNAAGETSHQCLTCNKSFSTQNSLEEHNSGKKHLKKIKLDIIVEDLRSRQLPVDSSLDEGSQMMMLSEEEISTNNCFTCKKPFTGPIPFHVHLQGKSHRLAVMKKFGLLKPESENGTPKPAESEDTKESPLGTEESLVQMKEESPLETKETPVETLEQTEEILDMKEKPLKPPRRALQCEPCNKKFTGPIPYNEHLKNPKHLKRVMVISVNTSETPVDPTNDSVASNPQLQPEFIQKIENNSETGDHMSESEVV